MAKPMFCDDGAVARRPGDGGVHADDLARRVDERSARVAGVDGGVGLDQVLQGLGLRAHAARRSPSGRGPRRCPGSPSACPPARPSALPMATTASPTTALDELPKVTVGRFERVVDLEQGHVLGLVVADERRRQRLGLAVLGDRDGAGVAALDVELDHVVVGDHLAVGGDDHAGALVLVAAGLDVDRDDGGDHLADQLRGW